MNRRQSISWRSCRSAAVPIIVASWLAGCGDTTVPVLREGDTPQPYMQFSVIVERANGSLGPAQASADALCAEVLQSAVMYLATDVGDDRTRYHFRCG